MDEQSQSDDRLHSVRSAAAFLGGVAESTIRVWLWQGRFTKIKVGRLVRIRESELLKMIGPAISSVRRGPHPSVAGYFEGGSRIMHFIYGLIDPRTMRIFHVGCAHDPNQQLNTLPSQVANIVAEMSPSTPQRVILQSLESHPQIAWVKWSKRFRRDLVTSGWGRYEAIANAFRNSSRTRRVSGEKVRTDDVHQAEFHEFDRKNSEVFEKMLRIAREFKAEGRTAASIDEIIIKIRYQQSDTNHTDGFKIGNTHGAFYSRKLQMVDPSLCGLFAMCPSMADDLVLKDGRTWRDFAREHSESLRFAGLDGSDEEDLQWAY
jgi:hypothetical protein